VFAALVCKRRRRNHGKAAEARIHILVKALITFLAIGTCGPGFAGSWQNRLAQIANNIGGSAAQALEWGLVNRVAPSVTKDGAFITGATAEQIVKAEKGTDGYGISLARLDEVVADLVSQLLKQFPECQRYTKQQVNFWKELAWHQTIGHARDWLSTHYTTVEPWEGMRAFVEKRPPAWVPVELRDEERA